MKRTHAIAWCGMMVMFLWSCETSKVAGIRRMAETRLKLCLERAGNNSIAREACKQESFAYCLANMPIGHTEKGCGLGGVSY